MNREIEQAFQNFIVPVSFLFYDGHEHSYVTYQETDAGEVMHADDNVVNYVDYYDFDVYVNGKERGNYFPIISAIKEIMESIGFMWEPTRDSGDLYEPDTGYFHKTICFSTERSYK